LLKSRNTHLGSYTMGLFLLCFFISSCHWASGVSSSFFQEREREFKKIAVLPFQTLSPEDFARISEVTAKAATMIKTYSEPASPAAIIEEMFWEHLSAVAKVPLVSPAKAGVAYEEIITSSGKKMSFNEAIRIMGEKLGADGVVVGFVYRYRERKGYDFAVEKPASIFFEIQLISCRDGELLWRAVFDKTQTSLMENVLGIRYFLRDRGKWITARELALEGVEEIVSRFPGGTRERK